MTLRYADCAMEQVSAPSGGGAFGISATAQWQAISGWPGKYQTFANIASIAANDTVLYKAYDASGNTETGLGTYSSGSLARTTVYSSTNGNAAVTFSGTVTVACSAVAAMTGVARGLLAGMVLSNDGTSPTTVVDIGTGQCADSTNAVYINLAGTFYKSTGGAWTAGAGSSASPVNGMGVGLTIAASTWYHVFAVINAGAPDVYFDTSATAANAPSGTTYSRRIGSFKTDASSHIMAFVQDEDTFYWGTPTLDQSNVFISTVPATFAVNVPPGIKVRPLLRVYNSNGSFYSVTGSPDEATNGTVSKTSGVGVDVNTTQGMDITDRYVNTSQQLYWWANGNQASNGMYVWTRGWIDSRGRFL